MATAISRGSWCWRGSCGCTRYICRRRRKRRRNRMEFVTKDSGERQEFSTGMRRDVQTNKPRYDLIGEAGWKLIKRWAELMGRGAIKYGELNFQKAETLEEANRFKASALRHAIQFF